MMWAIIFISTFLAFAAGCIYLISRVRRFSFVRRIAKERKKVSIAVSAGICILVVGILAVCMNFTNAIICILYLLLFWLISDLLSFLIKKIRKKDWKYYYAGIMAVLVTCIYMAFGWYQAHGVWEQDYVIHTDKQVGMIRAVLIADSHTGTTFDGDGFAEYMKKVQAQNPDVVLVAGDFVDDDTSLSDMQKCCAALGALDTKYGVYYVFGNHDKGYSSPEYRGYDGDDLVLSGHTHGGQLFLIRLFEELTGVGGNDQIYGLEKDGSTDFLVTSGISDWAIKFKTGCRSEFVVIDIEGK